MTNGLIANRPSLEGLVETGMLKLESLHPGGLGLTRELAALCNIQEGARVLDVACGTGETACFLAERFAACVYGVDQSDEMIRRAETKAEAQGMKLAFRKADAAKLPFADAEFDVAICECTLCLLDKQRVVGEMMRVVRPGGCVGMHDLCWKEDAPAGLKRTLAEIEGEKPETLEGWRRLFGQAGLVQIKAVDKSGLIAPWIRESKQQLGLTGQLSLALRIVQQWGIRGAWKILQSTRVFSSEFLGYGIIVGTKPCNPAHREGTHGGCRSRSHPL